MTCPSPPMPSRCTSNRDRCGRGERLEHLSVRGCGRDRIAVYAPSDAAMTCTRAGSTWTRDRAVPGGRLDLVTLRIAGGQEALVAEEHVQRGPVDNPGRADMLEKGDPRTAAGEDDGRR